MARLDFYSNFKLFMKVRLREKSVLIGRGTDCDIQLPSDRVSRHHARIEADAGDGVHQISNLSPNGTRVNAAMVEGTQALKAGDRLYIEDYVLIYQPDDADSEVLDKRSTAVKVPALNRPR